MATTANTSMVGCQGMNKHDQVIIFCYYWDTWPVWAATSCGISKVKVSDGERIRPNEAFVTLRCFHIRIRVQLLVQEESTNHKLDRRQLELTCQEWATASRGKSEALDMGGECSPLDYCDRTARESVSHVTCSVWPRLASRASVTPGA